MKPRVVLVAGGTGAIGSAIMRSLCADNRQQELPIWHVVACYRCNEARAMALQQETGCGVLQTDIGCEEQVGQMMELLPPLYAVINAAGIIRDALLPRLSRDDWQELFRTNSDGAFLLTRMALHKLQPGGRLIHFASRVGEHGNAGQAAYAASKAAVIALVKSAAREAAYSGITVNAICPGFVPSSMTQHLAATRVQAYQEQSLLGTDGALEAITATVRWLLSEGASQITGQVIHCDSRI